MSASYPAAPDAKPDTITITVSEEKEIAADRADLLVTVRGSSLFTGETALSKAREVAQMVSELRELGVEDADIHLESVHADVTSGMLGKSSSATYSLKIHSERLDRLADMLGVITSQKNTKLKSIVWGYPENEERDDWLDACIRKANGKARRIADALGVRLTGIRRFYEGFTDQEGRVFPQSPPVAAGADYDMFHRPAMSRAAPVRVTSEELGTAVSHSKTVQLSVTIDYHISRFSAEVDAASTTDS